VAAGQDALHDRDSLSRLKWLRQQQTLTRSEAAVLALDVVETGHEDAASFGTPRRQPANQFMPVHTGHSYIGEENIEGLGFAEANGFGPVRGDLDSIPGAAEHRAEKFPNPRFVVDDENTTGAHIRDINTSSPVESLERLGH
jgi:hypothetical protein